MQIPGSIVVTEQQADKFELEKIQTKLLKLKEKYGQFTDKFNIIDLNIKAITRGLS